MKRGTPEHPKVHSLAAALNVPRYAAVGILESLWHFAQEYAPAGDVGRFPDDAIARWVCWDRASAVLVEALHKTGWVDFCACHRIRVHDWPQHADQTVKRVLDNRGQRLLACYDDPSTALAPSQPPCRAVAVPLPSLAEPIPTDIAPSALSVSESELRRFITAADASFSRKTRVIADDVRRYFKARRKDWPAEQIIATPILAMAHGSWSLPKAPTPIIFLRDGEHAKTRNGNTYGARNWIAREAEEMDGTKLSERAATIARAVGVLEWLSERGVIEASLDA